MGTLWQVNTKHSGVTTWDSCVVWNLRSGPSVPESQQVGIPQTLAEIQDPLVARPAYREMPNLSQEVAPRVWGHRERWVDSGFGCCSGSPTILLRDGETTHLVCSGQSWFIPSVLA